MAFERNRDDLDFDSLLNEQDAAPSQADPADEHDRGEMGRDEPSLGPSPDEGGGGPIPSDEDIFGGRATAAEASSGRGKLIRPVIGVVALALFGGLIWQFYFAGVDDGAADQPMLIKADAEPFKLKPQHPGGIQAPPGVDVLQQARERDNLLQQGEVLLSGPEEPMTPPQASQAPPPLFERAPAAATDATRPTAQPVDLGLPSIEDGVTSGTTSMQPATAEVATAPTMPAQPPARTPAAATPGSPKPVPKLAPPPPAKPRTTSKPLATKPAPAKAALGPYRIQLASLSSRAAAQKAWNSYAAKYKDLLGSLSLTIESARVGGKTYFRVHGASLASKSAADKLCGQLKSRKQGCLVVKR